MEEIAAPDAPLDRPRRRRPDLISALMVGFTIVFLGATAWLRFGPSPKLPPPEVGVDAPPLRLSDLKQGEPILLFGLKEKVLWLTFWSAKVPGGSADLDQLDRIWKGLNGHRKFAMVAAAIDAADPRAVRSLVDAEKLKLPVYLASAETCRDYGIGPAALPVHYVIDVDGRVLATSRGSGRDSVDRLEEVVRSRLDLLDPGGGTRFAGPRGPGADARTGVVARALGR